MNNSYAKQWKKIRRIQLRLVLSLLIGLTGFMINHFISNPDRASLPFNMFLGAWALFSAWTAYQYMYWPCPRCGQRWRGGTFWHRIGPWSFFLRQKCPHCGLELP
jgi:predicted RNA-binding Zn-ribbon protein involved in translation (DUF1610 family)